MHILRRFRAPVLALVALLALAAPALAQTFPALTGRVVDQAQVLSPAVRATLTTKLAALESKSSAQVVVATIKSLQGLAVEDYADRLFREWHLGERDKNDGVLLLVAPADHKVRIEVGRRLEGTLPAAVAKRIVAAELSARFRAGQFDGVVAIGVDAIIDALTGDTRKNRAGMAPPQPDQPHVLELPPLVNILAIAVVGGLFLAFFLGMRWRRRIGRPMR